MSAAMPKFDAATAIGDSCKIQAASPRYVDPPRLSYELDAMCHVLLYSYRHYWFMQQETTQMRIVMRAAPVLRSLRTCRVSSQAQATTVQPRFMPYDAAATPPPGKAHG
ncbi:hypothetical protein MKX08_006693 [Trichoderma sp. CBMAI-0020]|nr:hypothetical protein MKX08_006693 [Trichoderma sp. CBMAI-0020]